MEEILQQGSILLNGFQGGARTVGHVLSGLGLWFRILEFFNLGVACRVPGLQLKPVNERSGPAFLQLNHANKLELSHKRHPCCIMRPDLQTHMLLCSLVRAQSCTKSQGAADVHDLARTLLAAWLKRLVINKCLWMPWLHYHTLQEPMMILPVAQDLGFAF